LPLYDIHKAPLDRASRWSAGQLRTQCQPADLVAGSVSVLLSTWTDKQTFARTPRRYRRLSAAMTASSA